MDPIILGALALIVLWAAGTWLEMGGWVHLLLTVGVFLLLYRVATRPQKAANNKDE